MQRWWASSSCSRPVAAAGASDTRLSREEFQSQANAICAKYQKQLNALGTPSSLEEIPDLVEQALAILNKEVAEIAALNPPEDCRPSSTR